jgi:gamma-glutamylcyclotransferase (GGCT)/AIG2-like uncharacterized protein YtfP
MNTNYHLFVYGSLRSGFRSPAFEYISRYFTFVSNGKVKGSLHDMGEYPAAKPSNEGQFIIGELYTINNKDQFGFAIAQLDDYEGVNGEEGEESLFRREITTVQDDHGKQTEAWVYWFNGSISNKPIIKSGDVLQYLEYRKQSL